MLEKRYWTNKDDTTDKEIVSSLASLMKHVRAGRITPTTTYITPSGTTTGNYYAGGELRVADPAFFSNAMQMGGEFLKKDMAGGTGGGRLGRSSWRIIALCKGSQILPGWELFWKHKKEIFHLDNGFLIAANELILTDGV